MAKYQITLPGEQGARQLQEVEADDYHLKEQGWVTFTSKQEGGTSVVTLRIKSEMVSRIERLKDEE